MTNIDTKRKKGGQEMKKFHVFVYKRVYGAVTVRAKSEKDAEVMGKALVLENDYFQDTGDDLKVFVKEDIHDRGDFNHR